MALSITERNIGEVTVLTCSGRIVEGDETQALDAKFAEAFSETPYIVLDLSQVDFLDSSGLGLLVRLLHRTRASAGDLKLCAVSRKIDTVLRATRLAGVFDLVPDVEAALAAFSRPAAVAAGSVRPPEILCVDRSADVLAYLKELLRQAGYEAITSTNIPDALTLLRATQPKVVVVGATLRSHPATRASAAFAALSSARAVIDLPENFSIDDAGNLAHQLIEQVRSKMAAAAT
jgi:anti-sigma B factor antagonist